MSAFVAAADLGTTGVKACVFRDDGALLGKAYQRISIDFPAPGRVEQNPTEIWQATRSVLEKAMAQASVSAGEVAALGLANQRSSIMAWDDDNRPLSALLGWQDTRTRERCDALMAEGFYVTPMMAASKAEWIVKDLGRRAAGGLRLGTPDSWLAARLCGDVHASDHSNASATGLYDHFQAAWDARLLDALGLDGEMLPALVDSSQIVGTTNAATFGAEIPLAGLVADQQASLFAMRCVTRGLSKISYGTSASVNMTTGSEVGIGGAGTFPLVAWSIGAERTYCVEGQVITAGAAVQWLRDGLGLVREPAEVAALADGATDTGVWMIPALQGLGTPIAKPEARAVIGGLGAGSTAADIARAVLDGIAQRVADAAESVWQGSECTPERVRVDGGASVNDFLMQRQADLLGIPVERSAMRDGGALGAAMMAGLAARVWTDSGELDRLWRSDRTFEPRMSESERGDERDKWKRRLQTLVDAGV